MTEADVYERLREKISLWPIKVPRTKESMEMLRTWFTEEEAEFLTHFTAPYQDAETIDQILHLCKFHQDNRVNLSCHRMRHLHTVDLEGSFCNTPECAGLCVHKNVGFHNIFLQLNTFASPKNKKLPSRKN